MGKIFVFMGPSCSGKDTIFKLITSSYSDLKPIIPYTTRPRRENEVNGRAYNFVSNEELENMQANGQIIERRDYETMNGLWSYATCSLNIDLENNDYITINTIDGYTKLKEYYGSCVVPILILTEDGVRLTRAIKREMKQKEPKYEELCRRFLADKVDFSRQKICIANIENIFHNDAVPIEMVVNKIGKLIKEEQEKEKQIKKKVKI